MGNFLTRFGSSRTSDFKEPPPSISLCDLLEQYPNKPWDIAGLSSSEFITIDFIKKHKKLEMGLAKTISQSKYNNSVYC
jgi:hypothetical protein